MSRRLRKDDKVKVMAGDSKGKSGRVLKVIEETNRAVVEGVNLVKKASRKTPQNPRGGFVEKEAPIPISNLQYLCTKCDKPVRLGVKTLADGKRVRYCKKCQTEIGG